MKAFHNISLDGILETGNRHHFQGETWKIEELAGGNK